MNAPSRTVLMVSGTSDWASERSSKHMRRSLFVHIRRFFHQRVPEDTPDPNMSKELLKVSTSHLATDVQSGEQLEVVILERGRLLLLFAHTSRSGITEHIQFVSTNDVIHRLGSFHQAFSGGSLELLLANILNISDTRNRSRTCYFLCVEENQIHTIFLKGVAKPFYHADKGADIFLANEVCTLSVLS